ncbi:hypothetical protein BOTBODRAFT_168968 [Botryobasidium botryosum FD-172 SS1]|uniref:4a-hydroxytetrahydrobiopterin dehydratase n=1 Tax=Botryobasidium botryosum (strain FD-172 SS1) TaxID=930990 RepID=A0A067N1L9_BOTB1|nr:hypothetical protein BOTBODRAFT_168968 [Botryobasidium botryosum FD-172 SS1]
MIPTLPPRTAAKTYPPLVSQTELETYLTPLYRAGWWISETHGHLKPSKEGNPVTVPVSQMSRQYELKSFKSAIQFVNDLAAICAEERHHPIFSVDFNKVSVHVFTHTAHPPPTSKPTSQPHSIPGITSRDLRFATRLESRFRSYLEAGNAVQPDVGSKGGEMWQPVSVHELHIPIRIEGSETLEAWQCPYI